MAAHVTAGRSPRKISATSARELPKMSRLASRIQRRWSKAGEELPLERLAAELGDSPRAELVAALKELEKAGLGEFSVGSTGHRASFVWAKRTPQANPVTTPRTPVARERAQDPPVTTPRKPASERRATDQWQRAPKRPSARDASEAAAAPASLDFIAGTAVVKQG
jgi:DNA-binding transcriptional MocR family regulator